nr:hypothetical protein HAGR004_37790 [Bdellovibrio sp. HAGR004]
MSRKNSRRSNRIILTNEARVLRDLRISNNLSMKKAGDLIGKSDSYIAHIETGRMDIPEGQKLDTLLAIYGGIKQKSFYERVRKYQKVITEKDELLQLIDITSEQQISRLLDFLKAILANQ